MKISSNLEVGNFPNRGKRGFTLIELIVVMGIITTMAGISYGVFFLITGRANEDKTELIIRDVASAMEARASDISAAQMKEMGLPDGAIYPEGDGGDTSTEALIHYITGDFDGDGSIATDEGVRSKLPKLVVSSAGKESYIAEVNGKWLIVDSWGTPLRYTYQNNGGVYSGTYHTSDDGFDIVSAGPDRDFGNSGGNDAASKDNIILK